MQLEINRIRLYVEADVVMADDVKRYVKSYFVTQPALNVIEVIVAGEADVVYTYNRYEFDVVRTYNRHGFEI